MRRLKNAVGGELMVFAEKGYLDREQWEVGMKMIGRQPEWDEFSDHVVIDATMPGTPRAIVDRLAEGRATGFGPSFSLPLDRRALPVRVDSADGCGRAETRAHSRDGGRHAGAG